MRAWILASPLAPTALAAQQGPRPNGVDVPEVTPEGMPMSGLIVVTHDRVNPDRDR